MNRISCENAHRLVPLYLSGEITGDPLAEFSNHLAACTSCFADVERQMAMDQELREAVLSELCQVSKAEARIHEHIGKEYWRKWAVAGLTTAAALVMGFAVLASDKSAGPLEAAAKDHTADVVQKQPRRWSMNEDIAVLSRRVGLQAAAPDLTARGFVLDRARLCKLEGDTWLHLVYRGTVHEISLYLRPDDGRGQTRLLAVDDLSVGAATFKGVQAAVVSDSRDDCLSLANGLRLGEL